MIASDHNKSLRNPSVLLLTDSLDIGGLEKIVVRLANTLVEAGYEVGIAAEDGGRLWDDVNPHVRRHYAPIQGGPVGKLRYYPWLRKITRQGSYNVIHSHQRGVSLAANIVTLGTDISVVEHVHNVFLPVTHALTSFRSKTLIACGSAVARMLRMDYGRDPGRIRMVSNAVADNRRGADLTLPFAAKAEGNVLRILGIGRLDRQKNAQRFIRIIVGLHRRGLAVSGTWIGDGEDLEECRTLALELGASYISFPGYTRDVRAEVLASDLFLMTSRWEGLPLALLEVLALGRGAVVSDVGSCGDAVDYTNGLLYPPDLSDDELVDRIAVALEDDSLAAWGRASRLKYEEKFTLSEMDSRLRDIYDAVTRDRTAND